MGHKIDLTGRRFGRLLVVSETSKRSGSAVIWRCQCDCGKIIEIPARNLLHCGTVSCGCLRREKAKVNLAGPIEEKLGQVDRTNVSRIRSTRPQRNNKSGFRGVSWHENDHGGGSWVAVIYFQSKRYRLGFFRTPEEASEAYIAAKEHIHGDFVAWYDEHIKGHKQDEAAQKNK